MADVQNLAEYKVSIDGTSYDLMNIPPKNSPLVRTQKGAILKGLQLDEVTRGLARARKLYWCAYNGVAGFAGIRAKIVNLQDRLGQLCEKTVAALDEFEAQSNSVLENLNLTFKYLVDPEQREVALEFLASSAEAASNLAATAGSLAKDFETQASETFAAAGDTELAKGFSEQQKRDFEKMAREIEGKEAGAKKAAEEYDTLAKDYQQKYEEARHDASVESERAFISSIVGAVTKPFAAGLGAFAQAYAMKNPAVAAGTVASSLKQQNAPQTADTSQDQPEQDSDTPSDDAQKPDANTASGQDSNTSNQSKDPNATKKAAAAGAAAAADETAKGLGEASAKATEAAKSARDKEIIILKAQQEIAKARIEQISLLAQYAVDLKNIKQQSEITETTVRSLHIAIGALRSVAVTLRTAQKFWTQMQTFCLRLNSPTSGMQADVKRMSKVSKAVQNAYFKGDSKFKEHVVTYYAGWLAISLVVAEYREAAEKVANGIYDDIKLNPSTEASIGIAQQLGKELELEASAEIAELKKAA